MDHIQPGQQKYCANDELDELLFKITQEAVYQQSPIPRHAGKIEEPPRSSHHHRPPGPPPPPPSPELSATESSPDIIQHDVFGYDLLEPPRTLPGQSQRDPQAEEENAFIEQLHEQNIAWKEIRVMFREMFHKDDTENQLQMRLFQRRNECLSQGHRNDAMTTAEKSSIGHNWGFQCTCGKTFVRAGDLSRHKSSVHNEAYLICPVGGCSSQRIVGFLNGEQLIRHLRSHHDSDYLKPQVTNRGRFHENATSLSIFPGGYYSHHNTEAEQKQTSQRAPSMYGNDSPNLSDALNSPKWDFPRSFARFEVPSYTVNRDSGLSSGTGKKEHNSSDCSERAPDCISETGHGSVPSWLQSVTVEAGSTEPQQPQSLEMHVEKVEPPQEDSNVLQTPSGKGWSSDPGSSEGDDSDMYGGNDSIFGEENWISSQELGPHGDIVRRLKSLYANCLYWMVWQHVSRPSTSNGRASGHVPSNQEPGNASGSYSKKRKSGDSSGNMTNKGNDGRGQGGDDDERSRPPVSNKRQRPEGTASQRFACPFFKRHPDIFISCGMSDHESPSRVKLHINRKHRLPIYCPRCSEVFKSEQERDRHIRIFSCTVQPEIQRICATSEQIQKLSRRSTGKTDRDRWNEIYQILFPTDPLPESPYLDSTVSAEVNLVREAFLHAAPAAVRTAIRMAVPEAVQAAFGDEELERIVHATHVEVFDQILGRMQSNRSGSQRLPSAFGSDASGTPDSGIGGSSNAGASRAEPDTWQDPNVSPLPELTDSQLEEMALALPFNWSFGQDTDLTL